METATGQEIPNQSPGAPGLLDCTAAGRQADRSSVRAPPVFDHDGIDSLDKMRLEAIRAGPKVESLRITFAQWHTEMKPERQAAILQEAFGGKV